MASFTRNETLKGFSLLLPEEEAQTTFLYGLSIGWPSAPCLNPMARTVSSSVFYSPRSIGSLNWGMMTKPDLLGMGRTGDSSLLNSRAEK